MFTIYYRQPLKKKLKFVLNGLDLFQRQDKRFRQLLRVYHQNHLLLRKQIEILNHHPRKVKKQLFLLKKLLKKNPPTLPPAKQKKQNTQEMPNVLAEVRNPMKQSSSLDQSKQNPKEQKEQKDTDFAPPFNPIEQKLKETEENDNLSQSQKVIKYKELLQEYKKNNLKDHPLYYQLMIQIIQNLTDADSRDHEEYTKEFIDFYLKDYPYMREKFYDQYKQFAEQRCKHLMSQANAEFQANKFQAALDLFISAANIISEVQEEKEQYIQIQIQIGTTYQQLNHPEMAIDIWERTINQIEETGKKDDFKNELIYMNNNLGQMYYDKRNQGKAILNWEKAVQILEEQAHQNSLEMQAKHLLGHLLNNIGIFYYQKGEIKLAIKNFEKTIKVYEMIYSKDHISIGNRLNNLGEAYRSNKQYSIALERFHSSLKIKKNVFGATPNKSVASTYNNIGMTLQNLNELDDAIENFKLALEIYDQVDSEHTNSEISIQRSITMHSLGECYRSKLNYEMACEFLNQSYQLKLQELKMNHKSTQHTASSLASSYFLNGNYEMAQKIFEQVLQGQQEIYGKDSLIVAQTMNNIGTVLSELNQYEQAQDYVQQSIEIFQKQNAASSCVQKAFENLKSIQEKLDKRT